ncbi:MAG: outer membrane lipoprotein-sorting protein [Myxococcota bacterium]|jgi:outer membrane lipoprotein-sorting protein
MSANHRLTYPTKRPALILALLLGVALLTPGLAFADTPPSVEALKKNPGALLAALDKRHNHYPTQKWDFEMVITPSSGAVRTVTFNVWQKGTKRLVRFTGPGDIKGMSVLSRGSNKMYVFSPQTGNARSIAAHAKRQTLLGSDMGFDDMSQLDFAPSYSAVVTKSDATHVWLDLTATSDDANWKKLRLRVDAKHAMIDRIEYLEDGKMVKLQERTDFAVIDGVPTYKTITVSRPGNRGSTALKMLTQKIGDDIPNRVFTKRSLVRGN